MAKVDQISVWTQRAADLRKRAEAGKGESACAWQKAQRLAGQITDLRAGPLDKGLLAKFMTRVDDLCKLVLDGADREQAWVEQERCTVLLQKLRREERDLVTDLLRRRLIGRDEAERRLAAV
jgi:hypothetical protein